MNAKRSQPPKFARYLLSKMFPDNGLFSTVGDIEEAYLLTSKEKNIVYAKLWYVFVVIRAGFSFFAKNIRGGQAMFLNYLKIGFRNIIKNPLFSLLNILSLSIGMVSVLLIMLYLNHETSYDSFVQNAENIYRVVSDVELNGMKRDIAYAPLIIAELSKNEIPEVDDSVYFIDASRVMGTRMLISYENDRFNDGGIYLASSNFFDIFTFRFLQGNRENALIEPGSVVITTGIAKKLFGDKNPIGETITVSRVGEVTVTGVVGNQNEHSHLDFQYIISFHTLPEGYRRGYITWQPSGYTYLKMTGAYNSSEVDAKLNDLTREKAAAQYNQMGMKLELELQPLRDIHLTSHRELELETNGNAMYNTIFFVIAVLVLTIASVNFINLSTAKGINRHREVGVRKVFGAYKMQLRTQFLTESVLVAFTGLILSLSVLYLVLPWFNGLTERSIDISEAFAPSFLLVVIGVLLTTGLIAGAYPAFIISALRPVRALKTQLWQDKGKFSVKKVLVTFQFAISIVLIVATLGILKQVQFLKEKDLGFKKENIVVIKTKQGWTQERIDAVSDELRANPNITELSFSTSVPGLRSYSMIFEPEGSQPGETVLIDGVYTDFNLVRTLGLEIVHGRNLSRDQSGDKDALLINESAAFMLGWGSEAVGKKLVNTTFRNTEGMIVGIVKDFHYNSAKHRIEPYVVLVNPAFAGYLSLRVAAADISETLAFVKAKWSQVEPDNVFDYFFVEDTFDTLYQEDEKILAILRNFTILAAMIAFFGLVGMGTYTMGQKLKEISVRKILGASANTIVSHFSMGFLKLILVANILALPVSYAIMNWYLQNFPYRVELGVTIFMFTGMLSLVIGVLAIGFQTTKASLTNPADILRSE